MAKKKPSRLDQLLHLLLYPLNWLEERTSIPGHSGLVGGIKYFLFRKVPSDISWGHTLGSAALTAFIVQAVTGVILAMYYKPDPNSAYESIRHITDDLWAGWLVRGMHRWGASVFIILLFLHMGRVFLYGAYKYPRELNWIIGALILVLGMMEGFFGYLLPWDQTAYWATVVGVNLQATGPFVGPFLGPVLQGGARHRARHPCPLLLTAHARTPRCARRADRAAPLARRAHRRQFAAVVADRGRTAATGAAAARRGRGSSRRLREGRRGDEQATRGSAAQTTRATSRTSRLAGSPSSRTRCSTTR